MSSTRQFASFKRLSQGQEAEVAGHRRTREILRSSDHIQFNSDPNTSHISAVPSITSGQTDSTLTLNDARSFYHDETNTLLTELRFEDGQLSKTNRSTICQQNNNASKASTFLEQFCRVVVLPVPAMQRIRTASVVLAQSLAQYLKSPAGKTSLSTAGARLPFGIRMVHTTASQAGSAVVQELDSRLVGWKMQKVPTASFVGYTFHPPTKSAEDAAYTYKLIVDHQSKAFLETFDIVAAERQLVRYSLPHCNKHLHSAGLL